MADWIRMAFGMVSGVSRGMSVLDGGSDRRRERGSFGGEFVASYCNQWGLCDAAPLKLLWGLVIVDSLQSVTLQSYAEPRRITVAEYKIYSST